SEPVLRLESYKCIVRCFMSDVVATASKPGLASRLARALTMDLTPLRASRDYRLVYTGQFVSNFGSAIIYVVLPSQMYALTKSTLAVGMLGAVEFAPMLLMAFIGGALADHFDRRRLVVSAELGLILCCLGLILNSLSGSPRPWILFLIAAMFAALNGIHR